MNIFQWAAIFHAIAPFAYLLSFLTFLGIGNYGRIARIMQCIFVASVCVIVANWFFNSSDLSFWLRLAFLVCLPFFPPLRLPRSECRLRIPAQPPAACPPPPQSERPDVHCLHARSDLLRSQLLLLPGSDDHSAPPEPHSPQPPVPVLPRQDDAHTSCSFLLVLKT